jgi:hypothetical protein
VYNNNIYNRHLARKGGGGGGGHKYCRRRNIGRGRVRNIKAIYSGLLTARRIQRSGTTGTHRFPPLAIRHRCPHAIIIVVAPDISYAVVAPFAPFGAAAAVAVFLRTYDIVLRARASRS